MPLIFVPMSQYNKATIRANPKWLYLFGDNEVRKGKGGQAKEARDEPNAIGVRTKRYPTMNPDAFWSDEDFNRCAAMIDEDLVPAFEYVRAGGTVVCHENGMGTGAAGLPQKAPRIFQHLRTRIKELLRAGKQQALEEQAQNELFQEP